MTQAQLQHPSAEQLTAFACGRLSPAEQAEVERHIAGCDECCHRLRDVPNDTLQDRLRQAATPRESITPLAPPGAPSDGPPPELANHARYRLIKPLGAGGMGVVYRAEHRLMQRPVALKIINRHLTGDPLAVERFRQEVRAAGKLSHPNIVRAFDADQAGDAHFLVMEYVEGISLARFVEKRGPQPVAYACHFIRQAALGLQHAYAHGLVHRDIKPQNLMLTRKGQVKILDFGLARLAREQGLVAGSMLAPGLTAAGVVLGTPDYIAPEQGHDSRRADIRSDIYSLGCTLYFLLTGRPPFPEGTAFEKLLAHLESQPTPLAQLRPDVPAALVAVIERMMAKDPARRYQTPVEVAQELAQFCQKTQPSVSAAVAAELPTTSPLAFDDTSSPRPLRRRPQRSWLVPVLGSAALVLACLATWLVASSFRTNSPKPSERQVAANKPPTSQPSGPVVAVPPPPVVPPAPVAGKPRVLFVLPQKGFWNGDYAPVRQVLEQGGVEVQVASSALTVAVAAENGEQVKPDLLLSQAKADVYDAVIYGGVGPYGNYQNEFEADGVQGALAKKFAEQMLARGKYLAGLCTGVCVLADAGVLKSRSYTAPNLTPAVSAKLKRPFEEENATPQLGQKVVVADRVITGRDFKVAAEFADELLKRLKSN